jgi:diguanylate cyclase (GGDEF)-like protein
LVVGFGYPPIAPFGSDLSYHSEMQQGGTWQQRVQALFTLERQHAIVLCAALFVAIAIADVVTPPALNLTFAYVFVILLACWNIGTAAALVYAALASAIQVFALWDLQGRALTTLYWWIIVGNRVFTFVLVVVLTAPLRSLYRDHLANARYDSLTGAVNRRQFVEILAIEIARSKRAGGPFSVAYFDCDNFKNINDTRGHAEGDVLLRTAVETMQQNVRLIDTVARVGGDEFIVLLPGTGGAVAVPTMERVRADLNRIMASNNWPVSFSIGLGSFETCELSPEEVMANCDALMYRAKGAGKDGIVHETRTS